MMMAVTVDYRMLLKRYMEQVIAVESVTFVNSVAVNILTREEQAILNGIHEEIQVVERREAREADK